MAVGTSGAHSSGTRFTNGEFATSAKSARGKAIAINFSTALQQCKAHRVYHSALMNGSGRRRTGEEKYDDPTKECDSLGRSVVDRPGPGFWLRRRPASRPRAVELHA